MLISRESIDKFIFLSALLGHVWSLIMEASTKNNLSKKT